jgi:hypothetical protein
MRLTTLGVGAMSSPRYAPAGLLVADRSVRIAIDGGPGAVPNGRLDGWLVTDERGELIRDVRKLAEGKGLVPRVGDFHGDGLRVTAHPVTHTNHPTFGYSIEAGGRRAVWAPEFSEFPHWAEQADLMFAEAASWNRPIRFRGGVGGHLDVLAVAEEARRRGVHRLVFAHIGRSTIRALARGDRAPFGEFASDGGVFVLQRLRRPARPHAADVRS